MKNILVKVFEPQAQKAWAKSLGQKLGPKAWAKSLGQKLGPKAWAKSFQKLGYNFVIKSIMENGSPSFLTLGAPPNAAIAFFLKSSFALLETSPNIIL